MDIRAGVRAGVRGGVRADVCAGDCRDVCRDANPGRSAQSAEYEKSLLPHKGIRLSQLAGCLHYQPLGRGADSVADSWTHWLPTLQLSKS